MRDDRRQEVFRRSGLLGTMIDVTIFGVAPDVAQAAACDVFTEIERLHGVFNAFDKQSGLSRWRRGEAPGPELAAVIAESSLWRERTNGLFNPAVGILQQLWDSATSSNEIPADSEIDEALGAIARNDPTTWNLNGIAKGWIVDYAAHRVFRTRVIPKLIVNAGGDLLSLGPGRTIVGIENPRRPYDNVAPLTRVAVADGAVATSGTSRRGWKLAGQWFGHVLDPRTGRPASGTESASVLAPRAADADVLATCLTIAKTARGLELADELGVGCLIVDDEGNAHRNRLWRQAEIPARDPSQKPLSDITESASTVAISKNKTHPERTHAI